MAKTVTRPTDTISERDSSESPLISTSSSNFSLPESINIQTPTGMADENITDPPTGNLINLELSQICDLVHSKSDEDLPGPSNPRDPKELQQLKSELETALSNMVQHEHHKQFMATALKNENPPQASCPKST